MAYTESLHYFFTVFFLVFGSLLGSFCNVVVLRMAISRSVIFPPSACPKCNHQLFAKDLVPIFSWLFLRGKCRYCKAPISIQYPLGESFMALIIGYAYYKVGQGNQCLDFICLSSGMAIWFVISEIFFRNEVLLHRPFIWAIVYSSVLRFLYLGKSFLSLDILLVLAFAALVGIIASIKNSNVEISRWAGISFLSMLYAPTSVYPYLSAALLILAFCNIFDDKRKFARYALFIIQLIAILATIYYAPIHFTFDNIIEVLN